MLVLISLEFQPCSCGYSFDFLKFQNTSRKYLNIIYICYALLHYYALRLLYYKSIYTLRVLIHVTKYDYHNCIDKICEIVKIFEWSL